ncbi:E3 SUMO-protein ligase ZBED1-like isoform X2 [Ambystoma mexicanum]|uniref:E3 SUMO-protein ligase ZBED1-like isoform X2 n=1 Tax=Ambystoma mexicanum TaxID=8296 RepID=UPI0037E78442
MRNKMSTSGSEQVPPSLLRVVVKEEEEEFAEDDQQQSSSDTEGSDGSSTPQEFPFIPCITSVFSLSLKPKEERSLEEKTGQETRASDHPVLASMLPVNIKDEREIDFQEHPKTKEDALLLEIQLPRDQSEDEATSELSALDRSVPHASEVEWLCRSPLQFNTGRAESRGEVSTKALDVQRQASGFFASRTDEDVRYHQHPIYDYYERYTSFTNSTEFRCRCCTGLKKTIIKVKGSTTSNLLRHIERAHHSTFVIFQKAHRAYQQARMKTADLNRIACQPKPRTNLDFIKKKKKSNEKKELDDALALMIAQDSQPLSIVENEGFRSFVRKLNCNYDIPSRKALTFTILPNLQRDVKQEVLLELGKARHVALTSEMWKSQACDTHLALTGHVLQEPTGVRKSFCLGVKSFPEKHTAEDLVEQISLILQEFGLPLERIASLTTGNSPNIIKAINLLGLTEKHIRCMGHSFHLIVSKAIKEVSFVDHIFEKCHTISTFFRNNPAFTLLLEEMQTKNDLPVLKLKTDVNTRWNSICDLAKTFLEQDIAINAALYAAARTNKSHACTIPHAVTALEADILKDALEILEPFLIATEKLSGQSYPTSSMVIPIITELQATLSALIEHHTVPERAVDFEDNDDGNPKDNDVAHPPEEKVHSSPTAIIGSLCRTAKELTNAQFGNIDSHGILGKATILDPRFKAYGFQEQHAADYHVKALELEIHQLTPKTLPATEAKECCSPPPKRKPGSDFWKVLSQRKAESERAKKTTTSELDLYMAEDIEDATTDVFSWWGRNSSKYPLLATLALKYLCGTATSVPSEQLFSKAGELVSSRRACLKSSHIEMLTFIKTNYSQCR